MVFLKNKRRLVIWGLFVLLGAVCSFAAFRFYTPPPPQVPTARVEQRDFLTTVRTRGEIKSTKAVVVTAPQTPDLTIVRLAEDGKPIKKGEVVVAFDAATQEERYTSQETEVRQVDSEILQAEAQHSIADEQNSMTIMQSEYNVERAKLEASKQEILSEIEGLKNRINVGISEGELSKANTNAKATDISQGADIDRLVERKREGYSRPRPHEGLSQQHGVTSTVGRSCSRAAELPVRRLLGTGAATISGGRHGLDRRSHSRSPRPEFAEG